MDLYVEKQCVDQMKGGDLQKLLLLFDEYFEAVYRYTVRRMGAGDDAERIVRLTFLDALGQAPSTPTDIGYEVWLYSLARPRVWRYLDEHGFLARPLAIPDESAQSEEEKIFLSRSENMFSKLSLEEREILFLKFFEQVSDGNVMVVLGTEDTSIGSKIYRVLKRAHFLLFGETEGRAGVYFGELSGLFEKLREMELIDVPGNFRITLRAELDSRIVRKDFATEAEPVTESQRKPFAEKAQGSNDPAKIFVEAVREMREEEAKEKENQTRRFERREEMMDFFDRWKHALIAVPLVLFIAIFALVLWGLGDRPIMRGLPVVCDTDVVFEGDFSDTEKRGINRGVAERICDHFEVRRLLISRMENGDIEVEVDVSSWMLEYNFVRKLTDWRIYHYERTPDRDRKSGQV